MAREAAEERTRAFDDFAVPDDVFLDAHTELDAVEQQLEQLRASQASMSESQLDGAAAKGEVHHVDLRTLLDLNEVDEEFDRRFEIFAGVDASDEDRGLF